MRTAPSKLLVLPALALALVLGACATSGATSRGGSGALTAEDIEPYASQDLYTIIQRMRPQWLQVRGASTAQGRAAVVVFIDGMQAGGLGMLRDIRAVDVEEIRHLSASDATTLYGTGMEGGAILITTKR